MKKFNKILSLLLALVMVLTMLPAAALAAVNGQDREPGKSGPVSSELAELVKDKQASIVNGEDTQGAVEIENLGVDLKNNQSMNMETQVAHQADEMVRVIVVLKEKSLLERGFSKSEIAANGYSVTSAVKSMERKQSDILQRISSVVAASGLMPTTLAGGRLQTALTVKYQYTVALNGLALEVPYGTLDAIRKLTGVENAYLVSQYELPEESMISATEITAEPNMYATNESFGAAKTWQDLGYTGKGMTIAVIDTGLDLDHPSFTAAPEGGAMTLEDVESVLTSLNAYALYGSTSAVNLTADKVYRNGKVPFAFNYVDAGLDVTHDYDDQGDHGTHVAGTAAANRLDTTDVMGVAPDAQLVIMKVFGQNGGAYSDDFMAAIEDCVRLNVDVINMSLGSPAGFTEDSVLINEVFGLILECDMVLAVAAGNSGSAAVGNGTIGTNLNLTQDPDNGIVTSPATYIASTMVASLESSLMMMPYFVVGENKVAYVDVSTSRFAALEGEHTYVMIPGLGAASDYEGLDVSGKIAVVQRGTIDFTTKQLNAYNAGAAALIVYDNVEGDLLNMYDGGYLPNVFVSKADGAILAANADDNGVGTLTIVPETEQSPVPNSVGGQMSDFSSWGVTSDLQLAPDVTAPGGNIYSAINNGLYGTMSGTSMASPHIAGMSALVLQYLHDKHSDLSDEEMHVAAEALVMSTAKPLLDPDGILYSPRKQGAGSADVYNAVTSPAYLTSTQANGERTPKASLGDDPERTGVYTFSFEINNFSDQDHLYVLDGSVLTDQFVEIDGREFMGETGRELEADVQFGVLLDGVVSIEYDANQDGGTNMADVQYLLDAVNGVTELDESLNYRMDLSGDGVLNTLDAQLLYEMVQAGFVAQKALKVPANSTTNVTVTVTLSDADKAYMEEHYENGIYVEGFIRAYAQSEGAVDLSLPFVGFYGDWTDARMFDSGWYYEDEATMEYNRYPNVIFTTMGADTSVAGNLGLNPYILEDYDPEHNVLSPNGDTYYDYVPDIYVGLMRSAELLDFTWTDEAGEELFYEWYAYARKSFYWAALGMCLPAVYTDGGCQPFTMLDQYGNLLVEDNEHLTLTIRGYLDDGDLDNVGVDAYGNPDPDPAYADDVAEIPVVIDLTAPKLDVSSVEYTTEDGRTYVSFNVEDNYDIAAVVVMTVGGGAYQYIPVTTKVKGVDGETATIKIDITDYDATFQVALCDYGCNESYYELTNTAEIGLDKDKFYGFRRYSTPVMGNTVYMTDQLNGWYSFKSAEEMMMHTSQPASGEATVYAAEYVDGYVIGAQDGGSGTGGANTLFAMKAGSWERIQLGGSRAMRKTVYQWPGSDKTYFALNMIALDMAFDYTTDTLYMLANGLEATGFDEGVENLLLKVDYLTGDVTVLGIIESSGDEDFLALTLACDNDGVLYTVNYENGQLYTIDVEGAESAYGDDVTEIKNPMNRYIATSVNTSTALYYPAAYTQSMTVDHETNTLYWAGYQGKTGTAYFFEMNKQTGALESLTRTADNAEMVGLFKPYNSGRDIIPTAALEGVSLKATDLYLAVGQTDTVVVLPQPFNADLGTITYVCYDESVATVSPYGLVEATGVGSTMIEIMCENEAGDMAFATCFVNVSDVDGTLFANSGDYWLLMDAGKPFEAVQIVDALELDEEETVKAAVYLHGYIYAAAVKVGYDADWNEVYTTNLYKLDANTLQGELIGSYEADTTALAFNYADGFMYGLTQSIDLEYWSYNYNLVRVNPETAEISQVASLNGIFDNLNLWETCYGALAIDYEGNFYVTGDNNEYYGYELVRFNLSETDELTNVVGYPYLMYGTAEGTESMLWSERNGGLLRATYNEFSYTYNLVWMDVTDLENEWVTEIDLGEIRGASYPGVLALVAPIGQEPELPGADPVSISLESVYTIHEDETVKVVPTLEPWNASGDFIYEIADETVATVDENGVITGVSVGETTITVTVSGTEISATASVVVEDNPGYLYGFFQADIAQGIPLNKWGKIPVGDCANSVYMSGEFPFTVYAADYYDGYVYAFAQSEVDSLYYFIKIDAGSFSYTVLGQANVLARDLAFDYTTGTMYVAAYTDGVVGGLYQMDLETAELTLLFDAQTQLVTLACDDEGVLYASDNFGELYTLNAVASYPEWIGSTGIESRYLQAMTYDYNNDALFMTADGSLYELEITTYTEDWGSFSELSNLILCGTVDVESGEMVSAGCVVSGLFSVPEVVPEIPETVVPTGIAMAEKNTVAVGETLTLSAVVLPVSVATVESSLIWGSFNEEVATVDQNGVVTGISAGETYIFTEDEHGNSAMTLVTVTEEHRYFYGYDELSSSWVKFDFDGEIVATWADAEGLSPIAAAQYIDGILYAYDADGYFYTVDTDTFERTLMGDGIHGMTTSLEAWDESGFYLVDDVPYKMIDVTYGTVSGRWGSTYTVVYGVMMAYNVSAWRDSFSYKIVELSIEDGTVINEVVVDELVDGEMSLRPSNLLYINNCLYTVNGYISGMVTKIDMNDGNSVTGGSIFADYWGDFNGGRSLIIDPLTGEMYAIRDKRTPYIGESDYDDSYAISELYGINLTIARADKISTVGRNMRITGLFIK